MLNRVVMNFLIRKSIMYNMEVENSIIINATDNLDSITEKIKSDGITNLIIGENIKSLPLFEGLQLIKSLEIRSNNINHIPNEAFINNQNIEDVILSNSVTKISERAFYNSSISSINLGNIKELGSNAFCYCRKLNQVSLYSIQFLTTSCFKDTSLVEVDLPSQLTIIPSYAFCNCTKLQKFKCNCIYIEHYAFCNCTSLKSFDFNIRSLYDIAYTAFLNTSIEEIEVNTAFHSFPAIKHLNITKVKMTIIDDYRNDYRNDHLNSFFDKIKLNIPNLKTIEFPNGWNYIFMTNTLVENIIIPPYSSCTIFISSCYKLKKLPSSIYDVKYVGDMPELEEVDLSNCYSISRNSFFNCPKLARIIGWGDHSMILGACLFESCPLIDISIWNSMLRAESNYYERYSPLENTYIKEMTIQSGNVPKFIGCKVLKKATFLENCGVTKIDDYLFYNCVSLTEVILCKSIKSIGVKAFKYTNISYFDFTNIYDFDLSAFTLSKT